MYNWNRLMPPDEDLELNGKNKHTSAQLGHGREEGKCTSVLPQRAKSLPALW